MKVLIVRFSSIGDIVLTTPILRALKEQIPGCEIHYVTREVFKALVQHNPHLTRVHTFHKSINEVLSTLREQQFDWIIDLHNNLRSHLLSLRLGAQVTRFKKLNIQKWFLVNFQWNTMPDLHVVDRYFGAVAPLGIVNDQGPVEIFIQEEDSINPKMLFELLPKTYFTIAVGAQFATKRMPEKLLFEIIQRVDKPVILLGGKEDQKTAQSLVDMLKDQVAINACGEFSILGSASLIQQSAGLLTGDTGLMHIASCFGVPIVSVWGNTVPELGMYPYLPNNKQLYSIHQVQNLSCRPCSKIGFQQCPKKHFDCMSQQNPEKISSEITSRFLTKE